MPRRSADNEFLDFVLDQLSSLDNVESRRMFSGHGLYCRGVFFAIVHRSALYLKVDGTSRPRFELAGMGPFRPNRRQTLRTYYEVPAEVLENRNTLVEWAADAVRAQQESGD